MIHIIYVDDEPENPLTRMVHDLMTVPGEMECELRKPPPDLAEVANWELDIFLIDYDLAAAKVDDRLIGYSGNSLATEVRNRNPSCPIVLISRKEALSSRKLKLTTARSDLDLILYKNEILEHKKRAQTQILTLYDGFARLKEIYGQPWASVLDEMGVTAEEARKIREAFPPIEHGHSWDISTTTEWIRCVLMNYPGILYDELFAAARLGISLQSFVSEPVRNQFSSAEYTGIFRGFGKRWWGERLLQRAKELMLEANVDGPVSQNFAAAFYALTGLELDLSLCVVDGTSGADQICHILRRPVKRQNSILYYPDSRPPVMDPARVSIKAIRESNRFDEDLVDAESFDVVKRIWGA